MTQDMPTFDSNANTTPFSETNEDVTGKNDIKNLGIKTTISITHNHIANNGLDKQNSPNKNNSTLPNPSQLSAMLNNPLGSTLRHKRGGASENENSPSRVMVTKTTFNYDSRTGVQQQITELTHQSVANVQKTIVKVQNSNG